MRAVFAGIAVLHSLCGVANATELSLSPTYYEFSQSEGHSIEEKITVYNSSSQIIFVRLYVGDFWYDKRGRRIFPDAGVSPYSSAPWITIPQSAIEIPPKGQITAPFVFAIPKTPPPSAYAAIFAERTNQAAATGTSRTQGNVSISLRIALPLLYRRPDVELNRVLLKDFSFVKPSHFRPLTVKFFLHNDDDTYLFPQGNILIVKGPQKALVANDNLQRETLILPKQRVRFEVPIPITPQKGDYQGLLTVFYGKKHLVQNFSFSIP